MSKRPKKKKASRGGGSTALVILLILLIAAAMGGVSFGVYRLLYKPSPRSSPTPSAPPVTQAPVQPSSAPILTPEPTPLHVHLWKEATCTEPRTCQTCGATEGEPLGHEPTEAGYWKPSVCLRCQEQLSPPLTPQFEEHNMFINMDEGMTMNYYTVCSNDPSRVTVGQAEITRYTVMKSSKKITSIPDVSWVLPDKPGYEWHFMTMDILFSDYNANYFGFNIKESLEDYYVIADHSIGTDFEAAVPTPDPNATPTPRPNPPQVITPSPEPDETLYSDEDRFDEEAGWYISNFVIEYKDTPYICTKVYNGVLSGWDLGRNVFHYALAVQVPTGYDGCVFCLYDARYGVAPDDWQHFYDIADDHTLYFRMK